MPIRMTFFPPVVDGMKRILKSVTDYGKTIKRVVVAFAFASVMDSDQGVRVGHVYMVYMEKD
jgi:hypothetical protein